MFKHRFFGIKKGSGRVHFLSFEKKDLNMNDRMSITEKRTRRCKEFNRNNQKVKKIPHQKS